MKRELIMRLVVVLVVVTFAANVFGVGGDMGFGTDPCTNGSADHPYLIEDKDDFSTFNNNSSYWAEGIYIRLDSDIDLSGDLFDSSSIIFEGDFNGCDHIISNLTINTSVTNCRFIGLFYRNHGTVSNLCNEDVDITCGTESEYIGGMCGYNLGTFNNCHSTGTIRFIDDGLHQKPRRVGGFCGFNVGVISNSYSAGSVSGVIYIGGFCGESSGDISNCYSSGTVTGYSNTGGFCGINGNQLFYGCGAKITNCYSKSAVTGETVVGGFCGKNGVFCTANNLYDYIGDVVNCYSTGTVSGVGSWGGFCGVNDHIISNSFWDVDSSGVGTSGDNNVGATGKTTVQIQTESTFTSSGWDFDPNDGDAAEWWINDGRDYPKVYWQPFGDLNEDNFVDMRDVAVMGLGWFSGDGDVNFNSVCELSGDWVIDEADLLELGGVWLAGPGWE